MHNASLTLSTELWKGKCEKDPHAAMRAPRITGTAMAASLLPLLIPPPPIGGTPSAAARGVLVIWLVLPNGPEGESRLAAARLTVPG